MMLSPHVLGRHCRVTESRSFLPSDDTVVRRNRLLAVRGLPEANWRSGTTRLKVLVHAFGVLFGGPVNCGVDPRSTVTPKPLPPPCASKVARLAVSAASLRRAGFGPLTSKVATSKGEQVARRGSELLMHSS